MAFPLYISVGHNLVATRALAESRFRVALVGTREPSEEARAWTRRTARRLAEVGAVVVSGGAVGIDAAAHEGALDAGGTTWCVLPCEPGHLYPPTNHELFERIEASAGALIWEADASPHIAKSVFHQRNAQIAALCTHLILVRGGPQSGALGAVGSALKLGRHSFALSAAPWERGAEACREALKLGALDLRGDADMEALFGLLPLPPEHSDSADQLTLSAGLGPVAPPFDTSDPVQSALATGPLSLENLLVRTGLGLAPLAMRLLTLEGECVVKDPLSGLYRLVRRF